MMDDEARPPSRAQNKDKKSTTGQRLQNLLAESTIHGLSRLHHSESNPRRAVWCTTILVVLALVGAHLSILINDFLANETDVDVKRAESRTLEFPAVTICNANPIKRSALEQLAPHNHKLRELLDLEVYGRTEPGLQLDTWTSYGGEHSQYYLSTETATYHEARLNCHRMEAAVVNITSVTMALDFRHAIGADYYVDFYDTRTEGSFPHSYSSSSLWDEWRYKELYRQDQRTPRSPANCLLASVTGLYVSDCERPARYICQRYASAEGREDLEFKKAEAVTRILASLSEEEKRSIGHQVTDLMFYCRYNGRSYNVATVFQPFSNPYLGNCYTFNVDVKTIKGVRLLAPLSGRRHGLQLGINIEQNDILRASGGVPGAVLLIHSKYSPPFPEDRGIVLTPGLYNAISIRVIQINRLPAPYGECHTEDTDATDKDAYISQYNATYSKMGCMKTCYQRYMIEICQCALPYYPRHGKPFGYKNATLCDPEDANQQKCRKQVDAALAENKLDCNCVDTCHESVYVSFKTAARWPMLNRMDSTIAYLKKLYPKQFISSSHQPKRDADRDVLTSNFLKAAIFYEDMHHEIISETPAYTVFQFVGDIGGMLALWIGVSALGVVQIIEFVMVEIYIKANNAFNVKVQDTSSDKPML